MKKARCGISLIKITDNAYKEVREYSILSAVNHPKVIKCNGSYEEYGLIFDFLDCKN